MQLGLRFLLGGFGKADLQLVGRDRLVVPEQLAIGIDGEVDLGRIGLIRRGRDGQSRPCELEPAPLKQVAAWTDAYRAFWDASFDRLDVYLQELQDQPRKEAPRARPRKRS